jgi:GT2 family glycosyltransferase
MTTAHSGEHLISIVILNYKRRDALVQSLESVMRQEYKNREIIVVDNHSDDGVREFVESLEESVSLIELSDNRGACGGRNAGLLKARGEIIVTLDNDVYFDSPLELNKIVEVLGKRTDVHVLAFQLCDAVSGRLRVREWCHPRSWQEFGQSEFETDFFVEGACACRREVYAAAGLYFEPLFIYGEGHDLALRILDRGFRILYSPQIRARHLMSPMMRNRERTHYLFTRNYILITFKNYSLIAGCRFLVPKLMMMFYFTLRSGCYQAFFKGLWAGISSLNEIRTQRTSIDEKTLDYINSLERGRPGLLARFARHREQPQL